MTAENDFACRRERLSPAKKDLLQKRLRGEAASGCRIPRRASDAPVPLSFAQQRLWFLDRLEPGGVAYNMHFAVRIAGPLQASLLRRALEEIGIRHEILRTVFGESDGQPWQTVLPQTHLAFAHSDLSGHEADSQQSAVRELTRLEAETRFDLASGPLWRVHLVCLGPDSHVMTLTMHHIVSDGWSIGVLWQELAAFYTALVQGNNVNLPHLPLQYGDFACWQRALLQGEKLEQKIAFWRQALRDIPAALALPTDHPRPPMQTFRGASEAWSVGGELAQAVRELARRHDMTLFMALLAAFKILLYRLSGETEIVVGTPVAGRSPAELERLIGFFIHTLVLRTSLADEPTVTELLGRVRATALAAYAHQEVPFEKLVETLQPQRNLRHTPLFQVMFNLLNLPAGDSHFPGLAVEALSSTHVSWAKFDLTLYAQEQGDSLRFDMVYNADLFTAERVREMLAQLEMVLRQMTGDQMQPISRLCLARHPGMLPDPACILRQGEDAPFFRYFDNQARIVPERVAAADHRCALTYGELYRHANRLANWLLQRGAGGKVVAIYARRSVALVWALLGVLKAGAAFVILDPRYPPRRLLLCLQQACPHGLISLVDEQELPQSLRAWASSLPCHLTVPESISADAWLAEYGSDDPAVCVGADDRAYLAFTSGSTGIPKGIVGTHRPVSHFLQWHIRASALTMDDRFSMLSGLAHDPLLRDIFTPLAIGATLCIPDTDTLLSADLARWMAAERISVTHLTPAMGQLLVAGEEHRLPALRYAFFAGDTLKYRDVERLRRLAQQATFVNFYGATETPQAMGYFRLPPSVNAADANTQEAENVPLGHGIDDVQLLLINGAGRLSGVGEPGEIHIRTPYLASGYVDSELTAQKFIVNPFTNDRQDRLYKTGDMGRYRPDGEVEFVARGDAQIKIRGFRVEPGEVEHALAGHPQGRAVALVVFEDDAGEKRLVAYYVGSVGEEELYGFLGERLPDYMLPAALIAVASIPLTPNGKPDYKALPLPTESGCRPARRAPRSRLEWEITALWREMLAVADVGIDDNFFALGGHSMLAVRLMAQLAKMTGVTLPLRSLFAGPTIAQLADALQRQQTVSPGPLVAIQPKGVLPPFYCVHPAGGNVLCFAPLAGLLGAARPFYALQARGVEGRESPLARIEEMAAYYLQAIRERQPHGPYWLGGWSMGGIVALAMADMLVRAGQTVALLALFDAPLPGIADRYRYADILSAVARESGVAVAVEEIDRLDEDGQFRYVLGKARDARVLPPEVADEQVRRLFAVHYQNVMAISLYQAPVYPGKIVLFQAGDNPRRQELADGWRRLAGGGLEICVCAGGHEEMMRSPQVIELAERLKPWLL